MTHMLVVATFKLRDPVRFRILVKFDDLALYTIHWVYLFFEVSGNHLSCSDSWRSCPQNGSQKLEPWRAATHQLIVSTLETCSPVQFRVSMRPTILRSEPFTWSLRFRCVSSEPGMQSAKGMVRARDAYHDAVSEQSEYETQPLGIRPGRPLKGE